MNSTFAVIPVKDLSQAKSRLAPWLNQDQRRALMLAMLRDVLSAVTACAGIEKTLLLLSSAQDADFCLDANYEVLMEPRPLGLNGALHYAVEGLAQQGAQSVLILPGDIPLVQSDDLQALIDFRAETSSLSAEGSVELAPNQAQNGTNALLCTPANSLPFRYGAHSYRQHKQWALALGLRCQSLFLPNIALDVDTPQDLIQLAWALKIPGIGEKSALEWSASGPHKGAQFTGRLLMLPSWQELLLERFNGPQPILKQVYP